MKTSLTFLALPIIFFLGLNHAFSQQHNSKILDVLFKEFHDGNLYFKPMDSITKEFKNAIIEHKRNVTLAWDERRTLEIRHQTLFEDVLIVKPSNVLLFDTYKPDTIYFYFNNKRLTRYRCHLKLNKDDIERIYIKLNELASLEVPLNTYWRGYSWWDVYSEASFYYDDLTDKAQLKEDDIDSYIDLEMFKPAVANLILEKQTAYIKSDRNGVGNSTFSLSVSKLESIIKSHMTIKTIEYQFANWATYGGLNNVEFEFDEKTQDHTLPLFVINYQTTIKRKYFEFKIEIPRKTTNPIAYFEVTCTLNGLQLAQFKRSLITYGYLLNENLSEIFNKATYQNPTKDLMITIKENSNGYSIGIRK